MLTSYEQTGWKSNQCIDYSGFTVIYCSVHLQCRENKIIRKQVWLPVTVAFFCYPFFFLEFI